MSLLDYLFGAASYMPHGYCLLWRPDLVAMHATADGLTALSYFSIPAAIHVFLRRRTDLEYGWLAWLFVAFIGACGLTHAIGLATLWQPIYGFEGLVKLGAAGVSVATAIVMWPLLPKVLALPTPTQLRQVNDELRAEVSQRKQLEGELRESQQDLERRIEERTHQLQDANTQLSDLNAEYEKALLRLRSILDNTVDALVTIDEHGMIEDYNPACERIFGYSANEAIGQNVRMLMTAAAAKGHDEHIQNYVEGGSAKIIGTEREVQGQRKDGETIDLELSVSEIQLGDRRLFSGIMRDITERKQVEAQRDDLVARLQTSNRELEQFAYIASHDLRAPLRALSILPNWLKRDLEKEGAVSQAVEEHLTDMKTQAARMDQLLTDLLDYSRIGRMTGSVSRIDPNAVIEKVRKLLDPMGMHKIEAVNDLPPVETVPTQFQLVVRNLISNAIKHHDRASGRIAISGGYDGNEIFFEVSDDGPGIPPEFHARIFDMFSTLRSRDEVEGSGMGLALIRKTVDGWGGKISVRSDPAARGATFRFTVPGSRQAAA